MGVLRTDALRSNGMIDRAATTTASAVNVRVPGLGAGRYRITAWDTSKSAADGSFEMEHDGADALAFQSSAITSDRAFAVRSLNL